MTTKARKIADIIGNISNDKLQSADLDVSFENISDTGTEGTKVASGTTAQRGTTTGQWRYNSTTGFFEGRNSSGSFSTLEPTPTVSSVDDGEVDSGAGGNQTIVITGTNFSSGAVASFVGSSASFDATTTTVDSSTQITAVAPKSSFLNAQEPYKVKVSSTTGIAGISATGLINVDNAPTWTTSAGSLGSISEDATGNHFTVVASDPEGDTVAYSLQSGSLSGLSLNSSTGVISGDPTDVSSDTTNSFTLRATAGSKTTDRAFTYITQNNPLAGITEIYNSNTSGIAGITSANNISDVTSGIAGITGYSNWTGTKLHYLADGGNCGNWKNIVDNMATSGGLTVCLWAKGSGSAPTNSYRHYELYSSLSEYNNYGSNKYSLDTCFQGSINIRTLTGNSGWSLDDWHFYCYRYSIGVSSSTQTFKYTTDYHNSTGTLHTGTYNNVSCSTQSASDSGFMGHGPSGSSGVNSYNWEGYTGGWRVFNGYLTDAQVSYIYNSGDGRF